ncbi:MAG: hypothetical protein QM640_02855 [Niabella sp.]
MIPIRDKGCYCFTLETIDTVDIFTKPMYKQIIVHSLNHFIDNKGLVVYGWCLTSNKLYIICQEQHNLSLKELRKEFVAFTCKKLVEALKEENSYRKEWLLKHFEKPAAFTNEETLLSCWGEVKTIAEIDMQDPESMADYLELIHSIPVKERVVQYPADYLYSSARDYNALPGLVKIIKLTSVEQQLTEIENRKNGFRTIYKNNRPAGEGSASL